MSGWKMGVTNIFQYWHGDIPDYIRRLSTTVQRHYTADKGYNFVFLTDDKLPLKIQDLFKLGARIEHISDIIRYYFLVTYGGVWIDTDIVWRRYIDFSSLLAEDKNRIITTNVRYPDFVEASTGVLACNRDNRIMQRLYNTGLELLTNYTGRDKVSYIFVGPALVTSLLHNKPEWYCLPDKGYLHQLVSWDNYHKKKTLSRVQQSDDWYFAHFCGYNVTKWVKSGFNQKNVVEQTVRLAETQQT